jgi:hypothetical protein
MSESKRITMWIEWSDEDASFIGYCPQFFPYGAVCHEPTEAKAVAKLAAIVRDELDEKTRRIPPTAFAIFFAAERALGIGCSAYRQ